MDPDFDLRLPSGPRRIARRSSSINYIIAVPLVITAIACVGVLAWRPATQVRQWQPSDEIKRALEEFKLVSAASTDAAELALHAEFVAEAYFEAGDDVNSERWQKVTKEFRARLAKERGEDKEPPSPLESLR